MNKSSFFNKAEEVIRDCFQKKIYSIDEILMEFSYYEIEDERSFKEIKLAYLSNVLELNLNELSKVDDIEYLAKLDSEIFLDDMEYIPDDDEQKIQNLILIDKALKEAVIETIEYILDPENEYGLENKLNNTEYQFFKELPILLSDKTIYLTGSFNITAFNKTFDVNFSNYDVVDIRYRDKETKEIIDYKIELLALKSGYSEYGDYSRDIYLPDSYLNGYDLDLLDRWCNRCKEVFQGRIEIIVPDDFEPTI